MIIFMTMETPDCLPTILEILQQEAFCENKILDSAIIGVNSGAGYVIVHPKDYTGDFLLAD